VSVESTLTCVVWFSSVVETPSRTGVADALRLASSLVKVTQDVLQGRKTNGLLKKEAVMRQLACVLLLIVVVASCYKHDTGTSVSASPRNITEFRVGDRDFSFVLDTKSGLRSIWTRREGMKIVSTIEDTDGRLLFEVTAEFDGRSLIVSEGTKTDRLWIKRTETANDVEEHLILNGRELVVTYPRVDAQTMSESFESYRRGNHVEIHPDLLQAFVKFEDFYRTNNSLHGNRDATELISSLLSPELAEKVVEYAAQRPEGSETPKLEHCGRCIGAYCGGVGVATSLKCLFGGPANVLCDLGTIIGIACSLFEITCSIFSC
jgi:hypothetical protein